MFGYKSGTVKWSNNRLGKKIILLSIILSKFSIPKKSLFLVSLKKWKIFYQTLHFDFGFIGEPTGHWNAFENSSKLLSAPITRNLPGECTAVFILFLLASRRISPHQTWPKFRKNNCVMLRFISGRTSFFNTSESCWVSSHRMYARYAWLMPPPSAIFSPVDLSLIRKRS